MKTLSFIIVCILSTLCQNDLYANQIDSTIAEKYYQEAMKISNINPDSAKLLLNESLKYYKSENDSLASLMCLLLLIDISKAHLDYSDAYEFSWDALAIANNLTDSIYKSKTYHSVGILYSYFLQDESKYYLSKALEIDKKMLKSGKVHQQWLISGYYSVMLQHLYRQEYDKVEKYLDTCFILSNEINQPPVTRAYLDNEKANLLIRKGRFTEAEQILLKMEELFESLTPDDNMYDNHKGYLVLIYSRLGGCYQGMNDLDKAISYYKKSLEAIKDYKAHEGMSASVHMELANLFYEKGNYKAAYNHVSRAKNLNDRTFDTRVHSNSKIVHIKNQYKEDVQKKNHEITQKSLKISEQRRALLLNRAIIVIALIVIITGAVIVYTRNQRIKLKAEKAVIETENKLKEENAKAMIELKNKELTNYALQFIEKDKIIAELLGYLKENPPKGKSYNNIKKTIEQSGSKQWADFEKRFLQVHKDFYRRLMDKHSDLTSNDLKLVAMAKLNFTGKETADLMGVSLNSLHISRHRLRKKLGLEREQNLNTYIHSI